MYTQNRSTRRTFQLCSGVWIIQFHLRCPKEPIWFECESVLNMLQGNLHNIKRKTEPNFIWKTVTFSNEDNLEPRQISNMLKWLSVERKIDYVIVLWSFLNKDSLFTFPIFSTTRVGCTRQYNWKQELPQYQTWRKITLKIFSSKLQ